MLDLFFNFTNMKSILLLCCLLPCLLTLAQQGPQWALVIHGGAGTIKRKLMTEEMEAAYRKGLEAALQAGSEVLRKGGSSADAVEATIRVLELNPLFNAGKGAVFTHAEQVELDASFMDGGTGEAGAVAGVTTIKHPISAARRVMDSSVHVMMAGVGAEAFAQAQALELVPNRYFHTEKRLGQLRKLKARDADPALDHDSDDEDQEAVKKKYGTVGCVALDQSGNLAAGTSTGGMTNKRYGRIGDSPIIGAGTYADNATCGVSCTGHGEYFIRHVVAYDVAARMKYLNESVQEAADYIVNTSLVEKGGSGGLIAMDREGHIAMPFNSSGMFRGYLKADGEIVIKIYRD
jgi:L-asparaginase / beta-aspartyl-peptidase